MGQALLARRAYGWAEIQNEPRKLDPDGQALQALACGNRREALAILMREYGVAIYRYCHKLLRSRTLADDVHQLVFVQAFEDLEEFSGKSSFRPWLYSIANHRCLDALKVRRRWLTRFVLREDPPEEQPDPSPSGEDLLEARSVGEVLEACLDRLEPHVRSAVVLRYQEGFTYEEMARICRERPATLQARVARAMPLLRNCLERKGIRL